MTTIANTIIQATRSAYQASDALLKLNILKKLKGVDTAVAGTILHYLHPDRFPIFDYHARTTLKKAGIWSRDVNDDSDQAWLEYTKLMNLLASQLAVSLRDLDKALFAYDKYGPKLKLEDNHATTGIRQTGESEMKSHKHLCQDIITAAAKVGIDPFKTPFAPRDLRLKASDYGSFADWCSPSAARSGRWNKHVCLKVTNWTCNGKPLRYVLLPRKQWQ